MSRKILVIQHAPHEGLGSFAEEAKGANFETEFLKVWEGPVFPSGVEIEGYGAIISMGGPQSATEVDRCSWMKKELMVLEEALRQKKPILGICLGAQLLAKACGQGGRVYRGKRPEIGWLPITFDEWFSKRNSLFFQLDLARPHPVFHWHEDTFDFPTEGYRLAWSEITPNQAFSFQGNAFGLQFHVEMTEPMVRDWLSGEEAQKQVRAAGYDPDQILREAPQYLGPLREMAHKVFYGFTTLIRDDVRRPVAPVAPVAKTA